MKRAPKLVKGEEVIVTWVDITEDSSAEGEIDPYVFETQARFVGWKQNKLYGKVLLLSATFAISEGHVNEHYGVLAIPKGCILKLEKRDKLIEPIKTDIRSSVGATGQ